MKRSLLLILVWMLCLQAHGGPAADRRGWFTPHGNGNFSAAAQMCKESGVESNAEEPCAEDCDTSFPGRGYDVVRN